VTEYELLDIYTSFQELMHSWVTTYFSAVTAYLVAAYVIGAKLTRSQTVVATGCFFIFSSLCIWGSFGTGLRMLDMKNEIRMLNPAREFAFGILPLAFSSGIMVIGMLIALKFMWDVRRRGSSHETTADR